MIDEVGAVKCAEDAFDAHALDYLLKPFDDARFETALQRARDEIDKDRARRLSARILGLRDEVSRRVSSRIAIKSTGTTYFVATADIDWIQGAGVYAEIHVSGKTHLARTSLTELEKRLDPDAFVRVHRSTIVAVNAVVALRPEGHGDYSIRLRDGETVRMSRRYRQRCRTRLRF